MSTELTGDQFELLERLVDLACRAEVDPWESFVAVRLGLSGGSIHLPRVEPLTVPLVWLTHLDRLNQLGLLTLEQMPSRARVFRITPDGFARVAADRRSRSAEGSADSA